MSESVIETHPKPDLDAWDHVRRPYGYAFTGTLLAVFQLRDGQWRAVVENDANDGYLHIALPEQLEKIHD